MDGSPGTVRTVGVGKAFWWVGFAIVCFVRIANAFSFSLAVAHGFGGPGRYGSK